MSYQVHGVIVTIKASFPKCFCRGDTGMSSVSPASNLRAPHTQLNVTRRLFEAACCSLIVFLDTEVWLQCGSKEAPRRSAA